MDVSFDAKEKMVKGMDRRTAYVPFADHYFTSDRNIDQHAFNQDHFRYSAF